MSYASSAIARAIPCTLALTLAAAVPAWPASTPLDDFENGSDQRWARIDATQGTCDEPAIYDASAGFYHIESACEIEPGSRAFAAAKWVGEGSLSASIPGNGFVRASVTHLTWSTNAWVSLRSRGNERVGLWGYRYEVSADGSRIAIVRVWEHGSEEILAEANFFRPLFVTGEPVMIEAGAVGPYLSLKAWDARESEPAAPQLVAYDTVHRGGDIAIGVSHEGDQGIIAALFDDIEFRPALD